MNTLEIIEALCGYLRVHPEELEEPIMFQLRGNPVLIIEEVEEDAVGRLIFSMAEMDPDER